MFSQLHWQIQNLNLAKKMQNKMFLCNVYVLYKLVISKILILKTIHQVIVNKKDTITLISPADVSLPLRRPGIDMKTQQIYCLNSFSHSAKSVSAFYYL